MQIQSFAQNCYAFMPEEVKIFGDAFDDTMKVLHVDRRANIVANLVAIRIIALAKCGERNPERLRAAALESLATMAA